MLVAVGIESKAGYLSAVVNRSRKDRLQVGTRRNQRVQIKQRPTVFPQKASSLTEVIVEGNAENLAARIDVTGESERIIRQSPEVRYSFAVPPKGGAECLIWIGCPANSIPGLINRDGDSAIAAERVQVSELFPVPQERMLPLIPGEGRSANNLATIVQIKGKSARTSK